MRRIQFDPTGDLPVFLDNIESAMAEGAKSLMLLACAANEYSPDLLDAGLRRLPIPVSGGIFPGIIFGEKYYVRGSLVIALPFEAKVAHISGLSAIDADYSESVANFADALISCPTVFVFLDGTIKRINAFLDGVYDNLGAETKYLGGITGSRDRIHSPCLFSNAGLVQNKAQLVGIPYSSETGISLGWQKLAGPLLVTESRNETIMGLDYKPAFDAYREIVEIASGNDDTHTHHGNEFLLDMVRNHPLGIEKGGAFACEPFNLEGKSLVCRDAIPCLTPIYVLTAEPQNLIDASNSAARNLTERLPVGNSESLPIIFACARRSQFLQASHSNEVGEIADKLRQFGEVFGALTQGEIASDNNGRPTLFNNSIVMGIHYNDRRIPSQKTVSLVTTQYALAMLVKQGPDPIEVLRHFLSPALKLLHCRSGHVWLRDDHSEKGLVHRYSYPAHEFERIEHYPKLVEKIGQLIPPQSEIITEDSAAFHLFPLGNTGVLVFRRSSPLPDDMILALAPVLPHLGSACLFAMRMAYCKRMRNTALQDAYRLLAELEIARKGEKDLLDSKRMLGFILENIPHFVFWKNRDSVFMGGNGNFARLAGLNGAEEIVGKTDNHMPWENEAMAALGENDRLVMTNGKPILDAIEFLTHSDGRQFCIRMNKLPITGEHDEVTGVLTIFEDISNRRRVEEELRLNSSVFEHAQEGILITDKSNRIINANRSFSEMTGYSREELVGKEPWRFLSGLQDEIAYARILHAIENSGNWRGEIWSKRRDETPFAALLNISAVRDNDGELTHYVAVFGNITDLKVTEKRLENLAHFDPLTNLPNRTLLAEDLRKAILQADRNGRIFALAFLDLDDFKPVNDQHGHETGDKLLVEVAKRLKSTLRGEDSIARLGGDEFVLLLTGIKDMTDVEFALERLLGDLSLPYRVDSKNLRVSASIGVTAYPFDSSDADTLLRHADQAMYLAKQSGRNRFQWFDSRLDMELRIRQEKTSSLRLSLENHELKLYYQPKINLKTGEVIGLEALIRWQHPTEGILGPGTFLPLAEQSGLIIEIGDWVLEEAVRQMASWSDIGLRFPVSVNISTSQIMQPDFVDKLKATLARYPHVPPSRIEFEILETAALDDLDGVSETMLVCQQMGISFSLDDFGTGYSSLAYLKRLPVDTVKVDQSFVHDMKENTDDISIIEGVIGLARIFSRMVIAEGVETSEHGMLLVRLGCDFGQGYGIARPMPADEIPNWLSQFNMPTLTHVH